MYTHKITLVFTLYNAKSECQIFFFLSEFFNKILFFVYVYIYNLEFLKGLENFVKNTLSFGELLLVLFSNLILSKLFLLSIFFFLES